MKTWEQLLKINPLTWEDIQLKHGKEKSLFSSFADQAKKEITESNYKIAKRFGNFSNLPKTIKKRLLRLENEWQEKWGPDSKEAKKLSDAHDKEVDTLLEKHRKHLQITGEFPANKEDISNHLPLEVIPERKLSFEEAIQLQILEVGGQRSVITGEELLAELRENRARNKGYNLER